MKKFLSFILLIALSLNLIWTLPVVNAADDFNYTVEYYIGEWDVTTTYTKDSEKNYSVKIDNLKSLIPTTLVQKLESKNIDLNNVKNWDIPTSQKYFNTINSLRTDSDLGKIYNEFLKLHEGKILPNENYKWTVYGIKDILSTEESDLTKIVIWLRDPNVNFLLPLKANPSPIFSAFPNWLAKFYFTKLYLNRLNDFEANRIYVLKSLVTEKNREVWFIADKVCAYNSKNYNHIGYYDSKNIDDFELRKQLENITDINEIVKKENNDYSSATVIEGYNKEVRWTENFNLFNNPGENQDITSYYQYGINFNANGWKWTMAEQVMTPRVEEKLTKNTFTREGYKFLGWSKTPDSKTAEYTDEQVISEPLSQLGCVQFDLYAVWDKAPEIILDQETKEVELWGNYTDNTTTSDDIDTDIATRLVKTITFNGEVVTVIDTYKLWTYKIVYTITDSSTQTTTKTKTVNIVDTINPTVPNLADIKSEFARKLTPITIKVTDLNPELNTIVEGLPAWLKAEIVKSTEDKNTLNTITISWTSTANEGIYPITVTSTDGSGNKTTKTFNINNVVPGSSWWVINSKIEDVKKDDRRVLVPELKKYEEVTKEKVEEIKKEVETEKTDVKTVKVNGTERIYSVSKRYTSCPMIPNILWDYNKDFEIYYKDIANIRNLDEVQRLTKTDVVNKNWVNNTWLFEPLRWITRAEFLAIVLKVHCYDVSKKPDYLPYYDVDLDTWQARVIRVADQIWIIKWYERDTKGIPFKPNQEISKIEAFGIMMKMAEVNKLQEYTDSYTDKKADWQTKPLSDGEYLWILKPEETDYLFNPNGKLNRDDMVKIIVDIIKLY